MGNVFKTPTPSASEVGNIFKGNFGIGVDPTVDFGPTSATSYWNGITPPSGGYTIYQDKASNGPSIRTAANDSALLTILQQLGATGSTLGDALAWAAVQNNLVVANVDYPDIITSGLTFLVDSAFVSSYPRQNQTWYNLAFTKNNPNITAGGSYVSGVANGGVIRVPTSTPGITATSVSVTAATQHTYCAYVYISSTIGTNISSNPNIIGTRSGTSATAVAGPSIWLSGILKSHANIGFNTSIVGAASSYYNTWRYFVGTQDATTQRFYVDGVLVMTSGGTMSGNHPFVNICCVTQGSSMVAALGGVSATTFHIYNRALSGAEILQNYNSLKARYGF